MTNEPVTELDERFSEPGAAPTPWADTERALHDAELFWICTVRTDGRPHVTPLVAVWDGERLYFSTGPGEQKEHNLRANAHVALTTGRNEWQQGLDVVLEGVAERVTGLDELTRVAELWRAKWDGRWVYEPRAETFGQGGDDVFVFGVAPVKVLAFAKGRFGHTRHRF